MRTRLIVDHLPHDCTEQELTALFRPFGHVVSVRLIRDHLQKSLGFGFVEMEKPREAVSAVLKLDRSDLRGHMLLVSLVADTQGAA
jgi:RNA recognition motif-containing protein